LINLKSVDPKKRWQFGDSSGDYSGEPESNHRTDSANQRV
jgi:hypothetical protein